MKHSDDEQILINCWSCDKEMNLVQLSENDSFCLGCNEEVALDEAPYNFKQPII